MLLGTVIGVMVIPGLYYLFGKLADGRKILRDESNDPLSEIFERNPLERDYESDHLPHHAGHVPPTPPPPLGGDEGDLPEAAEIPPDTPPNPH